MTILISAANRRTTKKTICGVIYRSLPAFLEPKGGPRAPHSDEKDQISASEIIGAASLVE